jgi:hypothetical protein
VRQPVIAEGNPEGRDQDRHGQVGCVDPVGYGQADQQRVIGWRVKVAIGSHIIKAVHRYDIRIQRSRRYAGGRDRDLQWAAERPADRPH